jgi:N-acetylglutamate synthase-like GNAT family acetyltransferase
VNYNKYSKGDKFMENIELKELKKDDINKNILENFNRYQEVKRCYRKENGRWIIKNIEYIENWEKNKIEDKVKYFSKTINNGGYVFGAYENNKLIGFAVLLDGIFGSRKQYIQLDNLHVSYGYRHRGIGKKLFSLCIEKAQEIGIERIYISANTSEETQKFYLRIGCKDTEEINEKQVEKEPYDRQMEYKI